MQRYIEETDNHTNLMSCELICLQLRDNYLQIIDNIQQADAGEVLTSQTATNSSIM